VAHCPFCSLRCRTFAQCEQWSPAEQFHARIMLNKRNLAALFFSRLARTSAQRKSYVRGEQFYARIWRNNAMTLSGIEWL
jgi:hypothetical protein